MKKQLEQLKEFHTAFDLGWNNQTTQIDEKTKKLRISIMKEELEEVVEAMEKEPIENIAKEIADLLYVTFGTIGEYGLGGKIEKVFDEVHKSNMSKLGEDGKPAYREDGKVLKGQNYSPPDIKNVLYD